MGIFRNLALLVAEGNQDYYFNLSFGDGVPISCTELEYLQSTGTQYINTGISPDDINTTVEIKYQYLNNLSTGYDSIMGSKGSANINRFYPSSRNGTSGDRIILGNTVLYTSYDIEVHTVLFNDENHDCYLDGELVGNLGTDFTTHSQPMYLFALNNNGTKQYQSACRIYYCKIWKNGELISYLKPCLNADGTVCFFDTVRKIRLYNAGTGTFIYMHKMDAYALPADFTALDYITATGAQYINVDTQLWSNQNWIMKTTIAMDEFDGDNQLLGTKNVANANYQTKVANKSYHYSFNNTSNTALTTLKAGEPITVIHDNTSTTLLNKVGSTFGTATKSTSALAEDLIFGHRYGAQYFNGKIYNLSLWKDSRPVRNFIPCLNADGEAGLFDSISGAFYPSLGDLPFYDDGYEAPAIPSEYVQVDYISSTGTQYIDTGFYPTGDTRYDIKFTNCITSGVLFGAYNNTWTDGYGLYTNIGTKGYYYVHYNSNTQVNLTSTAAGTVILDRGVARINSSTFTINANVLNTSVMYPLYILAGNMDGRVEQPVICDLYYFRIYTSAGLQRDYVPVVRRADGKAGLYDRVTGEFYTSASSADFVSAPIKEEEEVITLPQGYTRVEYIQSNEKQYVNTNLIPTVNTGFEITYNVQDQFVANDTLAGALFGARSDWYHDAYNLTTYSAGNYTKGHLLYGGMSSSSGDPNTIRHNAGMNRNVKETLKFINGELFRPDGSSEVLNPGLGINTSYPIYIFGINQSGSFIEPSTMMLYSLKFYEGTTLTRHFIPAVRKEDAVPGLYCIITNTFYTNSGSGSFVAGPEVETSLLPSGYTKLSYLRSTGTQYIDTGIKPAADLELDLTASFEGNYTSTWDCLLHAGPGDMDTGTFGLRLFNGNSQLQVVYNTYSSTSYNPTVSITPGQVYSIQTGNNYLTLDGVTTTGTTNPINWTPNTTYSMYLFVGRNSGSIWRYVKATLYEMRIWSGGTLVRHYIPALNASNEPGLYDVVSETFFTNKGTGNFEYAEE